MVSENTVSKAVRFDESENRFKSLSTIFNKQGDSKRKIEELESKRSSLEEFSKHPRSQDDQVYREERPM